MGRYICSVVMGMFVSLLLIVLMPILALIVLVAGLLGIVKVNELWQDLIDAEKAQVKGILE